MQKTELHIDTTNSQLTRVVCVKQGKKKVYQEATGIDRSQNLLPLIQKALQHEGLNLSDITAIKVNPGPGSFTGTRVRVTVANCLGWVLGIPVNGKKQEIVKYAKSKFD